jgi:hypothetical protein
MILDMSLPSIRAIALRSPSYFVLKRMLVFIADLMAGSKSLIFCDTSMTPTPSFCAAWLPCPRTAQHLAKHLSTARGELPP